MVKFSLQRVLEIRERREQALAIRLADARRRVESARDDVAALEELRDAGESQWGLGAGSIRTVGTMQNATFVRAQLDQQIDEARKLVRAAEAHAEVCLSEFTVALQERRVLDKLKEKRMEVAQLEETRLDQATTDAVALTRFVRREPVNSGGAP